MQRQSFGPSYCSVLRVEKGPTGCKERVAEVDLESDVEETENERLLEEDFVEIDTFHFDQQSFRMDLPVEESDSDQESDETVDQSSFNLSDCLCNRALTFGVSLVALTALLGLLRFYHSDLPKDVRPLFKTEVNYNIEKRRGGLDNYAGILSTIKQKLHPAFESITNCCEMKLQK